MFIGRYYHNLEAKGRLAIPAAYREKLTSGGVITIGLDGCLFLFPKSYWLELSEKLASLPLTNQTARQFTRLLVQSAVDLELDPQGRTLIPDYLKENASLKKQVVVAGALTRIEIWDRQAYHQHLNLITQENPDWQKGLEQLNI
ncbi:division/cell wall cluster transcriptional repressor MraZ [Candidatus Collierbacteria bacterium RIFCSPLOWO2_01_FULL_50_23]|uniref:Transcriptional regulator MraZ n=2 Tax=Candidatus Collieribacteriota TaxID=1752725 RepID=A0A1F5EYE1_9BACT|nr:MAG: division/cell wall cluster transcriptional repressor MraZ [Candidatus Collierbacteria bacterium RIFCSPHIGHO2_01_FULL_50_25]OGD72154.1 MAG: division/cell wall cluster transcriptional repressor MraZ [Candidatus Collierbacteria bacterium RIFCSPHIGHO2_02_FULL_49_10]OGD74632.1 MAG: division/cell wall cluster transcriptional repressor MraZ [Candidatus Collierbacteria bacterium RIFCSPLOWO2_01_FULL_50_23]